MAETRLSVTETIRAALSGRSRTKMSALAGLDPSILWKIENGLTPSGRTIDKLASVLGLELKHAKKPNRSAGVPR